MRRAGQGRTAPAFQPCPMSESADVDVRSSSLRSNRASSASRRAKNKAPDATAPRRRSVKMPSPGRTVRRRLDVGRTSQPGLRCPNCRVRDSEDVPSHDNDSKRRLTANHVIFSNGIKIRAFAAPAIAVAVSSASRFVATPAADPTAAGFEWRGLHHRSASGQTMSILYLETNLFLRRSSAVVAMVAPRPRRRRLRCHVPWQPTSTSFTARVFASFDCVRHDTRSFALAWRRRGSRTNPGRHRRAVGTRRRSGVAESRSICRRPTAASRRDGATAAVATPVLLRRDVSRKTERSCNEMQRARHGHFRRR